MLSVSPTAGSKEREFERQEINRLLPMDVIERVHSGFGLTSFLCT